MKASLKFRDEQRPLFRAKVPLNVLGLPFQSGIVAGESKELTLNLGTFFESGPSLRIAYRPNDSFNPFSLILKTGTGPFGSPFSSSMLMSAEFNLLGRGNGNPTFMLHFKPRFGDFSFKKSQSSIFDPKVFGSQNGTASDDDGSVEAVDSPVMNSFSGQKISMLATRSPSAGAISNLFSGMEVTARTTIPVKGRAVVNFRWGVRVPAELKCRDNVTAGIAFQKIPFLVMDKIGVEHVDSGGSKGKGSKRAGPDSALPGNADVAEACLKVKRQLEVLQAENGLLRNAVEDLRREICGFSSIGGSDFGKYREVERNGMKSCNGKIDRRNNEKKRSDFDSFPPKSPEADVSEELKKALKGAAGT
ncbi:uncharacterized protein LOC114763230 [Neltuma alba]|uniref:uncharacterized protein LOC114743381 n=1 Tax=Neltuma alba TaxID=207710 RepID=UPI0010A2FB8F|nr:uncharacterized protein LOC114743381 [Prosopis alba]XP_028808681.1 uncharacterized protein LOC114763230 [Prosopis alba]